jgi:hypothetical protein
VSDTYNYDAHRAHLSGSDSSQNSAHGINYHLDVRVDKNWPGLNPDPNKQKFDVEKMRQAARKIDELISALEGGGSGTAQSVQKSGAPSFGPDTWAAATYLKTAAEQMAGAVGKFTTDLVGNLRTAAQTIRAAADAYDKTEGANEQSGRNQMAGAQQQPSSIS